MTCDLCLQLMGDRPYRLAGLNVCAGCHRGALGAAWEAWGISGTTDHRTEWVRSGDNRRLVQYSEYHLTHATPSELTARFNRQWDVPFFLKWLGIGTPNDPEVGDPLFDDFVHIEADPDRVKRFLADEGVQTAVMSVIGAELGGSLRLDGRAVHCKMANDSQGAVNQGELDALLTALTVQVERFARGL